jgi:P4 family phage/plasmid primase-like protien
MGHDSMLAAVTNLIQLGTEPGSRDAYLEARDTYTANYPDHAEAWDAAAAGSVRRLGLPPVTLDISKPERKAIKERNDPKAVAAVAARRSPDTRFADDASLSEEVESLLRDRWAYVMNVGVLRYTGKFWERSEKLALEEACRTSLQRIVLEEFERAKLIEDKQTRKERMSAWSSYLNAGRIGSIGKLVMGIMGERSLELDAHPDLLNAQNGVVDLRTGELLPHDSAYMFTKIAGAEYHLDARSKLWKQALGAFESKGTRRYMQVRFGQAATGYPSDDAKAPFLHGSGSNGKSVILDGVDSALGDYAIMIDKSLLIGNPNAHPTMWMDLKGARLAYFEELPQGGVLNMERVKSLLGTRKIKGRYMGQDFQEFVATHSLMGTTNHTPVVADTDDGAWRRLLLVSFPWKYVTGNHVPKPGTRERQGDARLKAAFEKPDPAVLSWVVEGAMRWYANDRMMPDPPADVLRSTRDWREDADQVLAFAGARLILDEGHAIPVSEFYEQFRAFLKSRGRNEWSDETIRDRMFEHAALPNVAKRKVRGGATWQWSMPTPPGFGAIPRPDPKGPTWAYVNLRFREDSDPDHDDVVFMNIAARLEGKA